MYLEIVDKHLSYLYLAKYTERKKKRIFTLVDICIKDVSIV